MFSSCHYIGASINEFRRSLFLFHCAVKSSNNPTSNVLWDHRSFHAREVLKRIMVIGVLLLYDETTFDKTKLLVLQR